MNCNDCRANCAKEKHDMEFVMCLGYDPPKTNADRIRAMSEEELVKHLACQWTECKNMDVECDKCLLDWLREEAKDGEMR